MSPLHVLLVASALVLQSAGPDRVTLVEGGQVLEGRVVFEGVDDIVVRIDRKDQRIARKDIAQIRSLERSLATIVERDIPNADAATLQALAKECEQAGLAAEAKNLWLRVLALDPVNDAAVQGAGARRVGKDVKVALGRDQRNASALAQPQPSFKKAYEIETTHFVVRSDVPLVQALDLALALERFHQRFYAVLGAPLELYVFDDAPQLYVYGRKEDFPAAPEEGASIWFAPAISRVHVNAAMNPSVASIVHEVTQMMMSTALRRSAGATAQLPLWTAEGIAQVFAVAAPRERFGAWNEPGAPDGVAFATASMADVALERVFDASPRDFVGETKSQSIQACAYTLVHYLVFGENGALRAGFGKFLREGTRGKVSLNGLSQALARPAKEIESGWRAHVEAHAQ
ncbi:MAG: hypothetical protein ACKVWV_14875 [Planctomycetota bacterium]